MNSDNIFAIDNVVKSYGKKEVLRGVSLHVKKGESFGLLGVNGAGKTTLMRIILGLLTPNSGQLYFRGDIITNDEVRKRFGFLPENFSPPPNLKALEFLTALRMQVDQGSYPVEILEMVGLGSNSKGYIKNFSRGMIQRLGLACALLKNPDILVLDEPTLGLDPLGQAMMLKVIEQLTKAGRTVFFSSHILSQMERACSRIGILSTGKIIYEGDCDQIKRRWGVAYLEDAFLKEIAKKEGACL
jgi:ABC-type multidrug transport system ATPase subunit